MLSVGNIKIKRALISVYDKTGLLPFTRGLCDLGIELVSTGGTARVLKENGLAVTMVEDVTGFPEMMDGRVKTLHPKIHAAILADRGNPDHMAQLAEAGIEPIDLVAVSLYPFEETIDDPDRTFDEAVEMIDIGGPCMIRAAAKNHGSVLVVCDRSQYDAVLAALRAADGHTSPAQRLAHAVSAFERTSQYDLEINRYLAMHLDRMIERLPEDAKARPGRVSASAMLSLKREATPRYGENPHQSATLWSVQRMFGFGRASCQETREACLVHAHQVGGPEPSFNNYVDGDAALALNKELTRALAGQKARNVVTFIKHTNACGAAVDADPVEAYRRAYLGDPIAAAGGVLVVNFPVTGDFAAVVMETFPRWGKAAGAAFFKLDLWIAPQFDDAAITRITTPTEKRKWGASCRLLAVGDLSAPPDLSIPDFKTVVGGVLSQDRDVKGLNETEWRVATKRKPTDRELADLRLALLINKHTKSNAITLVKEGMLIGNGAGQMSRVTSARIAVELARELGHIAEGDTGIAAASDAFFPVPDGPAKLIDARVSAIIQPGGSNRDQDTIDLCDTRGVAMILTGTRHFKH